MRILFLDDEYGRCEHLAKRTGLHIDYAPTMPDFIAFAQSNVYDLIMLDHDLGVHEFSGVDASKFLVSVEFRNTVPANFQIQVVIHSTNPAGAANMASILSRVDNFDTYIVPMAWQKATYSVNGGLRFIV